MTEFLARISARRPLVVIAIWAVIGLIAGGFAVDAEMAPGPKPLTDILDRGTTTEIRLRGSAESERADRLLEDRLRGPTPISEIVIVQSDSLTVDAPEFQAKVEAVYDDVLSLGGDIVKPTPQQNYYLTNDPTLVSSNDRMTTVVPLVMTGPFEDALENIPALLHVVEEADGKDGFRVFLVGDASTNHDNNELAENDLRQGERVGIPIALVTLMIIMIGLAVGIDYSLVIISRYREELARGLDTKAAIERTGATAGRTVLFSGLTVIIALCGLLIVPFSLFQSLALGAIVVVFVALVGTLTLLPANLALLGPRINHLPIPFFGKARVNPSAESSGHGFWEVVTRVVTRSPVISIIVVGVPMIAATVFYFQIETGINGVDVFPEGTQTREAFFVMEENFPAFASFNPTDIVIDGAIDSPQTQQAIQKLKASLEADQGLQAVLGPVVNDARDLALLTAIIPGEPRSQASVDVVETIRGQHIPAAFEGVDAEAFVGGVTAQATDVFAIVRSYTPIVFVFVLGFSFLVLMLVFRSIVIPIKAVFMNLLSVGTAYGLMVLVFQKGVATDLLGFQHAESIVFAIVRSYTPIVFVLGFSFLVLMLVFRSIVIPIKAVFMNLLSVGTAYGLMVLVFQKGVATDLLGFQHAESIEVWVPLFLFAILFGLSMDYHVFLLSRIRERYDQTGNNAEAVAYGLRSTAGLITGAALIMVAVFGAFAAGKTTVNQQVGFGLSVAVLLDATLVRTVLVPASMEVLGKRNWYLPRFLRWLPDLRVEPTEESSAPGAGTKP